MKGLIVRAEWVPKEDYRLTDNEIKRRISYRGNMVWKNPVWSVEDDLPMPSLGPKDVLIKVAACGVCGSDVHMLMKGADDYIFFAGECGFPVIIGHEFAGEVVEVGSEVSKFKPGDLVTAEECQWCGECNACRSGWFNQCSNLDQLGFDVGNDGAFAEYTAVSEKYCWSLNSLEEVYGSKDRVLEAGALVEPTSVAYEGMFTVAGGFRPGGHVVVFGTGPIGLAAIQLARASGAARIIAFEPNEVRRNLAKRMGADYVFDPLNRSVTPSEIVMELTGGSGAAMAVEAAGAPSMTIPLMEKTLAVAGKIVLVGMAPEYPRIDPMAYQRNAGGLFGTLGHSGHGDFPNVINLMASGRVDMTQAITARFSLDNAVEAVLEAGKGNEGKVLVKP